MNVDTTCEEQSPLTHILASGEYSLMITAAGSGYSRWRDIALTRWRADPTCDAQGFFVYLKDVANGRVWSAGYQPVGREPDRYQVSFSEESARIERADGPIQTTTQILISPEDDTEVRRVQLTNTGRSTREIELTSYAEVVLADPAGDFAHPAFSKMFVQTEFVADSGGTLLATRRHREASESPLWMFHSAALEGEDAAALQFETDRARFLGRGGDARSAISILDALPLSDTAGTVLDPVIALRRRVRIPPGGSARVDFWTGVSGSRATALAAAAKYREAGAFERIAAAAAEQARAELKDLGIDAD
jgi:cyclic beta-1,2-glucan synthetase